jgi:hypothetical protein
MNLARQGKLNYVLDPRISFGKPDPNGEPASPPNVSISWEDVTARQALLVT